MNVQKLYDTLRFLDNLDRELQLQQRLEAILDSLNTLTSQPAQPTYQNALAQALAALAQATFQLRDRITPAQMALIAETGGEQFFTPTMEDQIRNAMATNAMTPSVARDLVQNMVSQRKTYLASVVSTHQGLQKLGFQGEVLRPGEAEMAFLIPRDLFKNHLGPFGKELEFINKMISDFSEIIEEDPAPIEVRDLSSSVPTIALIAGLPVMLAIGEVVNKFLDAWKKVEEIREIRERVRKVGVTGMALKEFTDQIKATVTEVVDKSTEDLIAHSMAENGRKNELATALTKDLHKLFSQIERGLVIEIRVEPPTASGGDEKTTAGTKQILSGLRTLGQTLQFPPMNAEPILLGPDEFIESDEPGQVEEAEGQAGRPELPKRKLSRPNKLLR